MANVAIHKPLIDSVEFILTGIDESDAMAHAIYLTSLIIDVGGTATIAVTTTDKQLYKAVIVDGHYVME